MGRGLGGRAVAKCLCETISVDHKAYPYPVRPKVGIPSPLRREGTSKNRCELFSPPLHKRSMKRIYSPTRTERILSQSYRVHYVFLGFKFTDFELNPMGR